MTIPTNEALAASGATPVAAAALPPALHVSTDTRTLAPGDTFVALRGESYDGHRFLGEALARGASALVVSERAALPEGAAALVVSDTTAALLAFAGVARKRAGVRVIAVTGSAGKTTTKALLAQLLEHSGLGTVAATPANENNEIGVAKLFLDLPPNAELVVVEFGARHPGDIATLARAVRPDVGVLTNVGDAHLEIMGSPEQLAETKWGLFATGARAVLNRDDAVSRERAASLERPPDWFAARESDEPLLRTGERITVVAGRERLTVSGADGMRSFPIECRLPGDHNRANLAAALAGALALGADPALLAPAVAALELPAGRYERLRLGTLDMIYDAYNASMSGTLATLGSFAAEPAGRRIAVLGGMAELGENAAQMHERVGAAAARSGIDVLLAGGDFVEALERGARAAGLPAERIVRFAQNGDAVAWLREHARAGDLVLLKGSRKYKLEEIRDALRAVYA
jgi:UDP-N-acetylmuramoyl-tripeptide--D-alanyl-D-alanine ligase